MEIVLLVVLILGAVLAFPMYVLARLSQLGQAVRELRSELARLGLAVWHQEREPTASRPAGRPSERPARPTAEESPVAPSPEKPPTPAPTPPIVTPPPPPPTPLAPEVSKPPEEPPTPQPTPPPIVTPTPPARRLPRWPEVPALRGASSTAGPAPPTGVTPTPPPPKLPGVPPPPGGPPASRWWEAWSETELESLLGANWLSKLGIVALAVAAAFFLKYAFESEWIGPAARIAIGVAGAAALFGLGQWLLSKPAYRSYAQVLMSGGIIILFLSIYAAYNYYELIGHTAAFAVLALAAVAASALAVANNTQAVALLCLSGAFLTPILLHEQGVEPGGLARLYAYLAAINVWSAVLVRYCGWHSLAVLSFGATWLIFFGGGVRHGPDLLVTEAFAAIFLAFACYGGMSAIRKAGQSSPEVERIGVGMILVGCLAFAVASARLFAGTAVAGLPGLTGPGLLLALLLASMSTALPKLSQDDALVRSVFRYLSAVAVLLLIGIALVAGQPVPREQAPVAFVFAALSYFLFLGVAVGMQRQTGGEPGAIALLFATVATHLLAAFRTLGDIQLWGIHAAPLWLPLAGALTLAALWAASAKEDRSVTFRGAVIASAQILPVFALVAAVPLHAMWPMARGIAVFSVEFLLVSAAWLAARRITVLPGFRADVAGAFGNAFVFFGLLAVIAGRQEHIGGVCMAAIRDDYLRRLVYLIVAITFLTIAIPLQLKGSYITITWAAESVGLIWAGLAARESRIRWFGIVLLLLAATKALLMDLYILGLPFLFNPRILSCAAIVAASYVSAWLLARIKEAVSEDERILAAVFLFIGTAFVAIFGSVELWLHLGTTVPVAGHLAAQHFVLTLFWSALAASVLAIGVLRRNASLRAFSLLLLTLAIGKALFVDLMLEPAPFRPLLNTRLLAGAAVVAAASIASWLLARWREAVSEWEADLPAALVLVANTLALMFVSLDLWQHLGLAANPAGRASAQHCGLIVFWSIYAVVALSVSLARGNAPLRVFSLVLLALAIGKALFVDLLLDPEPFRLLLNTRLLAGAAAVVAASAAAYLLHTVRDALSKEEAALVGPLVLVANVLALLFVSVDLWQHFGATAPHAVRGSAQQLSLSIFWSMYALGALSVGMWRRNRPVRLSAMGLLYLAIGKVFIFDLSFLQQPYRMVSFFGLGLILLLVSLLYTRFEERLK